MLKEPLTSKCEGCPFTDEGYVAPQLVKNCFVLFVGQNPGQEELKMGYPFCTRGQSGKMVRKYLDRFPYTFSVTNALKCGTPNNKTPTKKQLLRCKYKLDEEIAYCNPKLIVVFGKPALLAVTGLSVAITPLNGKILRDFDLPVLVCLHPSYIKRIKDEQLFEKGILPAFKFFEKQEPLPFKIKKEVEPTDEAVGFDLETTNLRPQFGELKSFSVSDGERAVFVGEEEEE